MITIHLMPGFDRSYLPVPAPRSKSWWQDNKKTTNHAQHCLPLAMANSLGYYILAPASFAVTWTGDTQAAADVDITDNPCNCEVDNHAAFGSFTVQPGFIPMTSRPGDFLYVKGIPNERSLPYDCMEALIESWWTPARFGLVFLLNQPGKFYINKGTPIAQMFVYRQEGGFEKLEVSDTLPAGYDDWSTRRGRADYIKDLDYLHGRHPDGRPEPTHISSWRAGDGSGTVDI